MQLMEELTVDIKSVSTSVLSRVLYKNSVMIVELRSGAIYKYCDIPVTVYHELMSSSSPGDYYRKYILGGYGETKQLQMD
jgi:hypothetical protein